MTGFNEADKVISSGEKILVYIEVHEFLRLRKIALDVRFNKI